MQTLHKVQDWQKVESIKRSIEENGWQGAPLVKWDDNLLTGVHRYEACRELEMHDDDIPTIDIEDVFEEAGLDFEELHAEYDYPTLYDAMFVELIQELPAAIINKYGIDIH